MPSPKPPPSEEPERVPPQPPPQPRREPPIGEFGDRAPDRAPDLRTERQVKADDQPLKAGGLRGVIEALILAAVLVAGAYLTNAPIPPWLIPIAPTLVIVLRVAEAGMLDRTGITKPDEEDDLR